MKKKKKRMRFYHAFIYDKFFFFFDHRIDLLLMDKHCFKPVIAEINPLLATWTVDDQDSWVLM